MASSFTGGRQFVGDVLFGARLALGEQRRPWARIALTALGVAVGIGVLLIAASIPAMLDSRTDRENARSPHSVAASTDSDSLLARSEVTQFRSAPVQGWQVRAAEGAPLPPGVQRLPAAGEVLVSPKLADVLAGPEGELLRPRVSGKVVGTIAQEGLVAPNELFYYQGVDERVLTPASAVAVDGFGRESTQKPVSSTGLTAVVLGAAGLLVPVVVYLANITRLAEAARVQRLSALRLIGVDARRVRRIAAGESLIGAVGGVLLGWGGFLIGRQWIASLELFGTGVFPGDVLPHPALAVLITVGTIALTIGTATVAMRRTIIEPLGVVRQARPAKPRLWWRLIPVALGLVLCLVSAVSTSADQTGVFLSAVVVLLASIPLLLPWILTALANLLARTGSISWQLALRRVRAHSTSSARAVAALGVVMAGVLSIQTLLASVAEGREQRAPVSRESQTEVLVTGQARTPTSGADMARVIESKPGSGPVEIEKSTQVSVSSNESYTVRIGGCDELRRMAEQPDLRCQEGDAFAVNDGMSANKRIPLDGGQDTTLISYGNGRATNGTEKPRWTLPRLTPLTLPAAQTGASVWLTPSRAQDIPLNALDFRLTTTLDGPGRADDIERLRNVAETVLLDPSVSDGGGLTRSTDELGQIQHGILLGSVLAFSLIGGGLFVSASEQVTERRRPMAMLAAVGARRSTLAWSVLWQNLVAMGAAVLVAVPTGLLLGACGVAFARMERLSIDVLGGVTLVGAAVLAVVLVSALTLPALRRAVRPEGLRVE